MKKIPMITLKPQTFEGRPVDKDVRIEATRQVAAVLTKLERARAIPDFADFHDAMVASEPTVATQPLVVKRKPGRPKKAGK